MRHALPRALRESPSSGLTIDSFRAGESLARSTRTISKYLAEIRPAMVTLEPALAKHFPQGTSPHRGCPPGPVPARARPARTPTRPG
jgi:hypothetical protein